MATFTVDAAGQLPTPDWKAIFASLRVLPERVLTEATNREEAMAIEWASFINRWHPSGEERSSLLLRDTIIHPPV